MTLINVRVIALQRHTLSALAEAWKGECWTSERSPNGWRWEFAFSSHELAQQFIAALPTGCQGVLEVRPLLQDRQKQEEPAEPLEQRQPPKLFDFLTGAIALRLWAFDSTNMALVVMHSGVKQMVNSWQMTWIGSQRQHSLSSWRAGATSFRATKLTVGSFLSSSRAGFSLSKGYFSRTRRVQCVNSVDVSEDLKVG